MKTILCLFSAILLISASCQDKTNTTIPPQLLSTTHIAGTFKLVEPASKFDVTLVMTPDSSSSEIKNRVAYTLSGRSSVNQYFGSFVGTTGSNDVQVSAIGSTKMAGPADAMQFESDYFKKLQAVKRYEITGNRLQLIIDGSNVLVYEKEK
ncbi:META domain-containing protein [Larkinella bovis]|uniref:META domain-containing protein n=1 Tax=Larkinella bovis TaxID=683041 RepID=A0ABW0IBR0_9BACT